MKNFNLIEWLQTDSHGKQSATRDHHGTKSRELPDNPRLYRYPCATLALPLRYVAMIFAVLVMSMANIGMAWGVDFTAAQIVSGTTSGNISVSTTGLSNNQTKNVCSGTKLNSVSANSGAGATYSGKYIEIKASSGYSISTLNLLVRSNNTSACNGAVVFWNGDASATCNSYDTFSALANNTSNCDGTVSITVPSNTRTIRIYRGPKINPSTKAFDSGSSEIGGTSTFNVFSVSATVTAACTEITPSLSYTSTSLMVGDNSSIPTLNKDGSAGAVTWTSSDEDVATVNSSGVVTAVGAGSATITASIAANGGKCEGSATENFTVTRDPVGEDHVITYIAQTGTGVSATLGTESKTSTSSYLTSLSDLTLNGLTISDAGKENSTPKIQTPGSEDASKYLYLTFNVASGYQFTITQISTKLVAVTDAKTVKCEISDNNGGTTQSLSYSHSKDSDPGTVHNFAFTSNNTYSGTVTIKLYVYGATSTYRLGKPLTITGDVTAAAPVCSAPTASWSTAPANGTAGGNMNASLTTNYAAGVVYTSSNTSVATVSGNGTTTCAINYVAAGTARITATVTGDGSTICTGPATCYTDITVTSAGSGWGIASSDNSWTASADEMSGSGTVTKTLSLSANADLQFKIVDISGNTWYGNGEVWGGTKTQSVSSTGTANNCHLLTTEAGSYTFSFNTSTKDLTITYPNSYTFYYANTSSWSNVYVYKFTSNGSTGNNAAWPGTQIASPAYTCGGTDYYAATSDGYAKLIFTNNSSQTGDMVVSSSDAGKCVSGTGSSWTAFPTYTVTYNGNTNTGGSVPTDASSPYACGSTVTVLGNTGSLVKTGYNFTGWNTAANGSGADYTAGNTFTISANTTLYAQWELIPTYTVTYNKNGDGAGGAGSVTGSVPTDATAYYSGERPVVKGPGNLALSGKTFIGWNDAANGSGTYYSEKSNFAITANKTLYAQWRTASSCPGPEGGTVFSLSMNNNTTSAVTFTYGESKLLSAYATITNGNASFTDTRTADDPAGTKATITKASPAKLKIEGNGVTIMLFLDCALQQGDVISYTETNNRQLYITTTPTRATSIVTSSNSYTIPAESPLIGKRTIYLWRNSSTYNIDAITITRPSTCVAPSLTAASTTAKGTTFTVGDDNDLNNYEFYVSTSSTAPISGTTATYTSTSKTKTIDDLYAGTTFYAWVRAVCGETKTAWTALTGNTFTTSTVSVTHTLTNVTKTSGEATAGGSTYTAVYSANTDYSMPTPVVTIDGNTATSGTDYTWTEGTGTVVIPANKITGNIVITIASAAAAPSSVAIGDNWLYFAGETISLTATPTGGNGPVTYQWYKGGKADGNAIEGATNATFSKTCAFEDAGSYYCKVTCGGSESTWGQNGDAYEVKVPHLYVKTGRNDGVKSDFGDVDFTRVDASTATASMTLGANWDYCYNIADGCGHYYGNAGTMQYNNYGPWVTNVNNQDCGLHTTNGATYVFTINYSNWTQLTTTVTFPSSDQAAGKVIYFDNYDRQWTNVYYRIGHSTHVQAAAMTKVYGTANLYKYTTTEYNGFAGWHITNATGETGSNKNIYNTVNSPAISEATAHEGGAVTQEVVTVTPTTSRGNGADVGVNNNCEFFNYDITSGMKTDNVSITAPSNGTITVSYTDVNNAAQSFTSGNRDLAHTVIITPMAAPSTGYDLSTLTVNGSAHPNNTTYTCSGATVVAATFSLHNYNVTYSAPGNGNNYTIKVADGSATSASKTATMGQTITIVATPATGYDFTGWTISKAGGGTVTPADASATTTTFTMPTDNVTITASFTLKTYTVTYNAGSGAGISGSHANDTKTYGVNLTLPGVTFTRTGYTQTGWATSDGGSQAYALSGSYTTNAAANLYPVWTAKTTTITINANTANHGSTTPGTVTATWGSALPSFTAASGASGWSLTGYWTAATGGNKIINADGTLVRNTTYATDESTPVWKSEGATLTLYAQYESVFTVSFNSNGGSAVSPITQASEGASITMPAAPTYADHTFQGWVIGGNTYAAGASYTPTANVTAYATWKADCAGGTTEVYNGENVAKGNTTASGWTINNSSTMALTNGSSNGYSYWYQAGSSSNYVQFDGSIAVESGDQIKIQWTHTSSNSRTLVLTINGSSASLTSGSTASNSTLVEAVYDATSTTTVTSIKLNSSGSSGCIIYQVTVVKGSGTCYYVTYDGNGAESGSISDATAYASGADVTVLGNIGGNAFTKAGYEFMGWNTLANGTGTPYSAGGTISGISGNVTLFAQWGAPCSDPDAPTGLAVGSITSSGATFTITDAANTNNYEIVCKTTSGTPAADATPTQTGTSKIIAVTGLNAYTDYYAYVRAVCNASHKSSWVALTGAPFKTLCEDPTTAFANGEYTIGGSALDLRTLISSNNSSGAITYTITNANGTGATIAGDGYSFSATIPGTANVRASQAANGGHCAVVLDATVTVAAATTCVTIAYFEETTHNNSSSKPDGAGKYLYGYDNSAKTSEYAYTLTTGSTDNKGQGTGASDYLRMNYGTTVNIYADNTTTGGTPESWSDVTSVSVDFKMKNSSYYTTFDIKVGNTTIADNVSLQGDAQTGFTTFTYNNLANLDGKISIINNGSGSSNYHFYVDNIRICTAALTECTTPVIPSMSDQTVCPGSDIAAWNATVSNAAAISAAGESVAYSWKKKGSDTELVNTASLDLGSSATEGQSGTYVVTVTVSADGKASASASKEVTLTVTPATETPSITASKAKVYAGDEVVFSATCGSTGVTWQWYRCTNAGGTITGSCLSTTSSYTLASAPAAGTYYYKAVATGDGTHSCGTAEYVYTLVVSAADACDKEFWFAKEGDRPTGAASATHITGCPSGSSSASYTASVDSTNYTLTGSTGQKTGNVTIVVPADNTGTLYVVVQGSSSRTITLSKGGTQIGQETPENSTWGVFTFDDLDAGTYNLVSSGNISWAMMALKLCPTVACTDDTPTAAATNATVCAGGSITITATGYETGATFQWQKQNASTSVWENIDNATSDTYTVATAAAEHAGNYHIVATMGCARTSNTVTIAVPSAPVFNSFTTTRRIMETQALSISDVSATDAVSYTWYKSADATWDAGDEEIGDTRSLLKPYDGETAGSTYYVFCRATNSCGATTSSAITVNVLTLVEEDCAIVGNSGEHNTFAKTGNVSSGTYGSIAELHTNSNNKYIYYTAESGYYFATAKVNACVGNASDLPTAAYSYSTDGGANWTDQNLTGMTTAYTDHVINLPANVNAFRVGRRLGDCGTSSNTIYIHQVCFTYNENCTKTTVDPSSSSVDYEIGDSFTEPTFTVKSSGVALSPQPTITYSSSDETVATVDDDGTVNFQDKAGTVVITASYAGDATYCDSEGSYTITVSCSDEAPKIIAADGTNIGGCNDEITLEAKKQDGTTNFSDGTYQWYRDGEAISGATGRTYTVSLTGVYSVERTSVGGCVSPSSNKATVTSESAEPEVERLTPFQYYHVDKVYAETSIMRFRHLFAVKNAGTTLEGKHFKMELSRNGGAASDVTNSNAFVMSADTVLLDMNKLYDKYEEDDELVLTCSAVDCEGNVSSIYKNTITIYVIDETPTLALICSGANGDGTRKTSNLVVGGDFLTGYNKADLCVQTGNTSFDKTQEWVLYTRLKENYIVTPVNGYAEFNKLNYEPFDILFLTDYPKASKSDAAATILDDMADLCDYRPLFTFKTHMVAKSPSKWAAKGFMAQPEVPKQSRLRLNIVCYAHPMFDDLKVVSDHIQKDWNDHSQIVYTMLTGAGHEGGKGMQGFPIDAAEGFVTIGLIHDDATAADDTPYDGYVTWTPGSSDVMLVAAAERQVNLEARMILFSVNCGAQSKLTETGRQVVLKSLEYLLSDATITPVADCSFTFTNGAGNSMSASEYASKCPACTGTKGDGKWSTAANWGPDWILQPGKDTEVKIAAHATVDMPRAQVRAVRILEGGSIDIPVGSGLEVKSTIRRQDGTEISPTEVADLSIGSTIDGNGTLILNNNAGDTKAGVAMYSKGFIDYTDPSKPKGVKNYQYMGTPFNEVNALYNYYGSWIYSWSDNGSGYGWQKVPNGGTMTAWTGYCITQETATTHWSTGTLAATGTVDIPVPAGENMVIGNSWTAPIYVKEFTNDDFENLLGNVYFFNTGVDKDYTSGHEETADKYAPSTYVTVPIHSSPYTGDSLISSMQGFFVKSNGSAGALHLDYDRHVRPTTNRNILSGRMHAPKRAQTTDTDEPVVLKIKVSGENYDDKLVLLAREDFSDGFDNGWDGDKWDGNESALYLYTTDSEGTENSVSAVPELEGTVIGFRAGEDDEYTMYFDYLNGDEKLYLWDTETGDYTVIKTGYAYAFTTADKEKHARFIITRSNGQEVATDLTPTLSQGEGAKAKKLLIGNKMYIMVDGRLFDATGKAVK